MTTNSSNQDKPETENSSDQFISTRSEIVFLLDAQDANPNGNPLSPANKPRRDPVTQQGIITDVRLKRYLRDQLAADGKTVYIDNIRSDDGNRLTRQELAKRVADELDSIDGPEDIDDSFLNDFLDEAADVRYFGATFSFSTKSDEIAEAIDETLPTHLTGPVQIGTGRSLHKVRMNEGYNSLTAVISNPNDDGGGKEQGGFGLDDHRIVYGLYGFSAVVNEHNGQDTRLTTEDVERLDRLFWGGIKNQANSRSKQGQHPRLYIRIEYDEGFHCGNLDRTLDLGDQSAEPDNLTDVHDATVDVTTLIDTLSQPHVSDRINTVHLTHDKRLELEYGGETLEQNLSNVLETEVGAPIKNVNPYE